MVERVGLDVGEGGVTEEEGAGVGGDSREWYDDCPKAVRNGLELFFAWGGTNYDFRAGEPDFIGGVS